MGRAYVLQWEVKRSADWCPDNLRKLDKENDASKKQKMFEQVQQVEAFSLHCRVLSRYELNTLLPSWAVFADILQETLIRCLRSTVDVRQIGLHSRLLAQPRITDI